jgi:hypothetical protein
MRALNEIAALLATHGFARARQILAHQIAGARLDARLEYSALAEPVGDRRRLTDAMRRECSAGEARHALFVLAGAYDSAVAAGRQTLTVDGVQPVIVEQAHALRRAAL